MTKGKVLESILGVDEITTSISKPIKKPIMELQI